MVAQSARFWPRWPIVVASFAAVVVAGCSGLIDAKVSADDPEPGVLAAEAQLESEPSGIVTTRPGLPVAAKPKAATSESVPVDPEPMGEPTPNMATSTTEPAVQMVADQPEPGSDESFDVTSGATCDDATSKVVDQSRFAYVGSYKGGDEAVYLIGQTEHLMIVSSGDETGRWYGVIPFDPELAPFIYDGGTAEARPFADLESKVINTAGLPYSIILDTSVPIECTWFVGEES